MYNDQLNTRTRNTKLMLKTLNSEEILETQVIQDPLQVGSIDGDTFLDLPEVYLKEDWPVSGQDIPTQTDIEKWDHLRSIKLPSLKEKAGSICIPKVTLMIGSNVPATTQPLETRTGNIGEPYAIRSPLGWLVYGIISTKKTKSVSAHFSRVRNVNSMQSPSDNKETLSIEDEKLLSIMEESTVKVEGHYQTKLPLRNREIMMPNNRDQAVMYAERLRNRLVKSDELQYRYNKSGNAERVPPKWTNEQSIQHSSFKMFWTCDLS
jgi:hypothetical protein